MEIKDLTKSKSLNNLDLSQYSTNTSNNSAFSKFPEGIDLSSYTTTNTGGSSSGGDISSFMDKLKPMLNQFMQKLQPILKEFMSSFNKNNEGNHTTENLGGNNSNLNLSGGENHSSSGGGGSNNSSIGNSPNSSGGSSSVGGNSSYATGTGKISNFKFQGASGDSASLAKDPAGLRSNVIKVGFQKGHFTTNSTSPRAELRGTQNLKEGKTYNISFGVKRDKNTASTIVQVLDRNSAKPSPRAWISTNKQGQYVLHLKEGSGSNSPAKSHILGKASVGKWDDLSINFKRGTNDGQVSVNLNGKNVFNKSNISTMFDTHSKDSYVKFGQYRNQGDRSPGDIYFSNFNVKES